MNSRNPNFTFKLVLLGDGRVGKTSLVLRYVNNVFSEKQEATVQASYLTKRLVIEGVPITLAIWMEAINYNDRRQFTSALVACMEECGSFTDSYLDIYLRVNDYVICNTEAISSSINTVAKLKLHFKYSESELLILSAILEHACSVIGDTAGQERFHALGPIYYRDADAALLVYDIMDSDSYNRVRKWVKELQQMASKTIIMAIAANKSDLVRPKKFDLQEAESYATSIGAKLFVTSAKTGTGIDEVFHDIATRLLEGKKNTPEGILPARRKGTIIIDDEPEKEPQPKCCS